MKTVLIFGGSGFIGRHLIRRLAKYGYKIIVPYQMAINEAKLRLYGDVGQIIPIKFFKISEKKITNLIFKSDVVINLKTQWNETKISFEEGIFSFNKDLTDIINQTNKNKLLIYFSGLALENHQVSKRSKSIIKSEQYFKSNLINSTIIRPGVIIGGGDQFMKRLLPIFKFSIIIPLFGSGNAKIQPVFVDDVAKAVLVVISQNLLGKNIYELAGKEIFTYKSIYKHISDCLSAKKYLFPLPFFLIKSLIFILEKIHISPIYLEQLNLLKTDNFASKKYKDFSNLNIDPQNIREIIKNIIK